MNDPVSPEATRISRHFHAPRARVFAAWTTSEALREWFSPASFTVPQARVEPQVGGVFEVCMRAPDGAEHWTLGRIVEMADNTRLVIDMRVPGPDGETLFTALTQADFTDAPGGTRVDIVQSYVFADPAIAADMVKGAPEGWRTTLDKLDALLVGSDASARSVTHSTFRIERVFSAAPARVWRALTDPDAKRSWFSGPPGQWTEVERHMDVRVGGTERAKGRWANGLVSCFDAFYLDVVEDERLVYAYEMRLDDRKISVSLATMELQAVEEGTRLVVTEQGAFLDGFEDGGSREQGTGFLLDALGASFKG